MKALTSPLVLAVGLTLSSFAQATETPVVKLPGSEIVGVSYQGVESFFGIPYAEPPAGLNRLKRPVRRTLPLGLLDASTPAERCYQGHFLVTPLDYYPWDENESAESVRSFNETFGIHGPRGYPRVEITQEDCLTITVQRPAGTKEGDNLPVLFMIQGYGFVMGGAPGLSTTSFLNFGVENNQPFILVTANYRMGVWGFLPGKEVMANKTANLGLYDQRMSMQWTSDNIKAFGGDPDRITLWGEGSGGVSVLSHLVINDGNATYNGRQLFHGAIMSSGSLMLAEYPDAKRPQEVYDKIVHAAGCSEREDSLQCLREITPARLAISSAAVLGSSSVEALRLQFIPRPDGELIRYSPEVHLNRGTFLQVPMIIGNQEDEGTIFAKVRPLFEVKKNVTFDSYLRRQYFYNLPETNLQRFTSLYSDRPEDGSPYRTQLTPIDEQWHDRKRIASILGDLFFVFPRRLAMFLIAASHPSVPLWGYQGSQEYDKSISRGGLLGTAHGSFEKNAIAFEFDKEDFLLGIPRRRATRLPASAHT
ncbi:hypothetical protein TrVFT333_000576 [Trichoderma virens FT-333]|nr:hypothetical protein TrVFT333_000576 [Trichoderma virens FT-333]